MAEDLSARAAANGPTRRAAADALVAADASGKLAAFRAFADASKFSTNVSADKILAYGETGEVLHTRAACIQAARRDEAAGLAAFAKRQGSWLLRREGFEDLWEGGREILYGAVNAGNMGTEGQYGPFCLVADPLPAVSLATFPSDTAQTYVDASGVTDQARAESDVTLWEDRGALALWKESVAVAAAPEDSWPDVMARPGHYMEVCRVGRLPIEGLASVRLRVGYVDRLVDIMLRHQRKEALDASEEEEWRAYNALLTWRPAIMVEEIP